MAGLSATTTPVISPNLPDPTDIGPAAQRLRTSRLPDAQSMAMALENLQANVNGIRRALKQPSQVEQIIVRDPTGRVIAALGEFEVNGVQYDGGVFAELYAGFLYGVTDPAKAIFRVLPTGQVEIGQNGWVDVLDPFGGFAAWIGTQYDTLPVTGAVNNGSGLIRLTVTAHTLSTGDVVPVQNVGGIVNPYGENNAQGVFTVTKIDANHIDLQHSIFVGTYTSGGTVARLLHLSGAANNGTGLIRLTTAVAHGYVTGDQVDVEAVGGVPNANGQWIVTVIDTTHFDLIGSTFAGTYTSGGTAIRYFAGGLFETIAVAGTTFANAKFRALANGDLDITNARIDLISATGEILLDPTLPEIIARGIGGGALNFKFSVIAGAVTLGLANDDGTPSSLELVEMSPFGITIRDTGGSPIIALDGTTGNVLVKGNTNTKTLSINGTSIIDSTQHVTNINSIDAAVYKVGGNTGVGVARTLMTDITFNTSATAVFGTPGAGQTNGTVITGVNTFSTKLWTMDSGILISEV